MTKTRILITLFAGMTVFASHEAIAQSSIIDLITCNNEKNWESNIQAWEQLKPSESPDGNFVLPGPVQDQQLCIKNITLGAAFGVLAVSAELCNSTPKPLLDWLAKNRASLQASSAEKQAGVIAAFGKEGDSLMIYHGRPSLEAAPDPKSKTVSFVCIKRLSGPQ